MMGQLKGKNILIACEFSGRVRDAFIDLGFNAISCDILPTESPGPHYQGDVRDILGHEWKMIIAFPPCRYLSGAGTCWLSLKKRTQEQINERLQKRKEALEFFMLFINHPCPLIAIENPRGYISTAYKIPDQYFCHTDHGAIYPKKTGLWLKGLPPLMATKKMNPEYRIYKQGPKKGKCQTPIIYDTLHLPPDERRKARSRIPLGVAQAMAGQWGPYVK